MSWGVMAAEDHQQLSWGMGTEEGWRKGPWTNEEDRLLIEYVKLHGEGRWNSVCRLAGLKRNGKSCRLRWVNYLRPDLKRGQITPHEEKIILELHARWGNRWSTIARSLPGRTDNEIKNYWRTHFKKKAKSSSSSSSDLHSHSDINTEKSKARLLRRQHFHLQQQQLQQQQQQQHQQQQLQMLQTHQQTFDMNKLVSVLDETHDYMNTHHLVPSNYTNMNNQYYYSSSSSSSSAADHQVFLYSMFNGYGAVPGTNNIDQETIWDGLWNLDDVNGNMNCNRNAMYHASAAAAPFC